MCRKVKVFGYWGKAHWNHLRGYLLIEAQRTQRKLVLPLKWPAKQPNFCGKTKHRPSVLAGTAKLM